MGGHYLNLHAESTAKPKKIKTVITTDIVEGNKHIRLEIIMSNITVVQSLHTSLRPQLP